MGGDGQAQGEYGHFVGRGDASGCVAKVIVEGVLRVPRGDVELARLAGRDVARDGDVA